MILFFLPVLFVVVLPGRHPGDGDFKSVGRPQRRASAGAGFRAGGARCFVQVFAMGEHLLQISGVGGGLSWASRTGDVFARRSGLAGRRQARGFAVPGIDRMLGGGATKRGFGFAQVL